MEHTCFPPEETNRILELDSSTPERMAAERCPRCASLLTAYAAFLEAEPIPGARPDEAVETLGEFVDTLEARGPGADTGIANQPTDTIGGPTFLQRLTPWLHPAPALVAAAALVIAGIALFPRGGSEPGRGILRGTPEQSIGAGSAVWRGASLHVAWDAVDGCDGYMVILLTGDLSELNRIGPLEETSVDIDAAGLPGGVDELLYVIVAMNGQDEVSRSRPQVIPVRP